MANLIVADAEYANMVWALQSYHEVLDAAMQGYIESVQYVLENGVKDELISKRLSILADSVNSLKVNFNDIFPTFSGLFQPYVSEIDAADNILY